MDWLPLTVFPEGSLASSIVTTVWVGVLVFTFMNLRFGWVYSGLVVPGYLVPLLIVKPWSAGVIVVEAILTLWTVQLLSRFITKTGLACEFFGRDRFVVLLMVSAVYRIVGDVWVLPLIGEYLNSAFGIGFDFRNNLQAFGLIVICLAANQLWKTGALRGGIPFLFTIGVTWFLVRYGLMEFTNFSITNVSFLYEDMAASAYSAPKAYIILITTALIASRMNLLYGWDFNGILIPALIALQWYEPMKILTSFIEAAAILFISMQVLKLPFFRAVTMEGSRKFLLFFTVSFAWKMGIGWALYFIEPGVKVSDFYGFGYLLPTLMAVKMHQKERVLHQFRITAQVSAVAVIVANVIGFCLTFTPATAAAAEADQSRYTEIEQPSLRQFDIAEFQYEATKTYIASHQLLLNPELIEVPQFEQLNQFEQGLKTLFDGDETAAVGLLNSTGFNIDSFGSGFYRIAPTNPASGRPYLFINRKTHTETAVTCPDALSGPGLFEASLTLFTDQSALVLAFGSNESPWMESFRRACPENGGIINVCLNEKDRENYVYVKESLPAALELLKLEQRFGSLTMVWEDSERINPVRDASQNKYCEFHTGYVLPTGPFSIVELDNEFIDSRVKKKCADFAPRASGLYTPPDPETLLFLDRHVLTPLFSLDEAEFTTKLSSIRSAAGIYGYEVTQLHSKTDAFLLLHETEARRYWGSVLVRLPRPGSVQSEMCFQISGRVRDQSLLSFAATQFRRFQARSLIISGTNTLTNPDATTRLSAASNRDSFFNLAHQAFCRSARDSAPLAIQCRAYLPAPGQPFPEGDIIVAPYFGNFPEQAIESSMAPVRNTLEQDGVSVVSLAYDDATSPYAAGFNTQARYMDFTDQGTFALFWLSPFFRENYEPQENNFSLQKMLKAVGIPVSTAPLSTVVAAERFGPPVDSRIKHAIIEMRDLHSIESLAWLANRSTYKLSATLDTGSSQLFLCLRHGDGKIALIANLAAKALPDSITPDNVPLQFFIDSRVSWLEKTLTGEER